MPLRVLFGSEAPAKLFESLVLFGVICFYRGGSVYCQLMLFDAGALIA